LTRETSKRRSGVRASKDAAVLRAMRQQSLKVPWRDLSDACHQLIVWRSFALWVRAIINAERALPDWLRERINQRCPGFVANRAKSSDYESIWVDLSAWVDEHFFSTAYRRGWLDALHFYSGRDPLSEQVWNQWTHVESEWRARRPKAYPSFEEWQREALNNAAAGEAADRVNEYIEWEALAFWARLIAESARGTPAHLVAVLNERCPGFVDQIPGKDASRTGFSTRLWRELLAWIERHQLGRTTSDVDLDAVRAAARTHLRGERIAAYWAHCSSRWKTRPPGRYPGFEEWLREADAFVTK
jgi:hypothetical protein